MNAPVPRCLPWCTCLLLPIGHRPSPGSGNGSANHNYPHISNFSAGRYFAVLGDSVNTHSFDPPDLLATQIAPTAATLCPLGSCGVYIQAEHGSLPSHVLDMLAVRAQAIDGKGILTPPATQPCRLLTDLPRHSPPSSVQWVHKTPTQPFACDLWFPLIACYLFRQMLICSFGRCT
jgi:hypothetical protein